MQVLLSLSYFDYPSRNGLDQLLGKCITQYFSHGNIHPNSSKKRKQPSKLNALAVCMCSGGSRKNRWGAEVNTSLLYLIQTNV
jgi:hypothetical protein